MRGNDHPAATAAEERLQASDSKAEINRASDDTQIGCGNDHPAATAAEERLQASDSKVEINRAKERSWSRNGGGAETLQLPI